MPSTRALAHKGVAPGVPAGVFVAPSASIIGQVEVGEGASVWYGAVVRGDVNKVSIGANASVGDAAVVHVAGIAGDLPTVIGSNVVVAPKATIHACTIEDGCLVGAGATVMDGARLSKGAVLAPGALVPPNTNIPSGQMWAGVPAAYIRDLSEAEAAAVVAMAAETKALSAVHMEECAKSPEQTELDERKWLDKKHRDPQYTFQPPEDDTPRPPEFDVLGKGVPGRIFDSNLRTPDIK